VTTPLPASLLIVNLPSISIVTPSFNQAAFLESAIRSVLDQEYPHLEYVVMDGRSSDGSVAILERYGPRFTSWTSEPDGGQYDAVTRGFGRTRGEIMGWLNSDDAYLPGALAVVGEIFAHFPQIEWLTTLFPINWDTRDRAVHQEALRGFSAAALFSGEHLPSRWGFSLGHLQQESTFWRRSLWERAGAGIDPAFPLAGDFALWAQFARHTEPVGVAAPLGGFRLQDMQKTARRFAEYQAEAQRALVKYGGRPSAAWQRPWREIATRCPVAAHRALWRARLLYRAQIVRWRIPGGGWALEERYV